MNIVVSKSQDVDFKWCDCNVAEASVKANNSCYLYFKMLNIFLDNGMNKNAIP